MATATSNGTPAGTNRRLTTFGVLLILVSLVTAWWLVTSVGDLVTALWMALFVLTGLVFISLGRHPDAE
ncbi:MAG: hypothetical protein ABEJ59_04420 [Halanaeroarchaeum sp.]